MNESPAAEAQHFECHLYVPARGPMSFSLPAESGPRRTAKLAALDYDALVDPGFRRLLATFESIPQPLNQPAA